MGVGEMRSGEESKGKETNTERREEDGTEEKEKKGF